MPGKLFPSSVCGCWKFVSPMALCGNDVMGAMWRAFCTRREDPRRDEYLQLLDKAKNGLSASEKAAFEEWNKRSYNVGKEIRKYVRWGAGPRAGQSLVLAAKARALLHGRLAATREDIVALAKPVMRHRLLLSFVAEAEQKTADDVVALLLRDVPYAA